MVRIELSITRRHVYTLLALLAGFALVVPTAGWAADKFKDVPDSDIFHDDIAWMADAGVTKGCNPPANDEFCPGDNVRRETMAAFMRRLAENRVVDAATVEGYTAAELMTGVQGPQGPPGEQGPKGDTGVLSTYWVETQGTPTAWAYCNSGDTLLGGGFRTDSFADVAWSRPFNHPDDGREGWQVFSDGQSFAYAVCSVAP